MSSFEHSENIVDQKIYTVSRLTQNIRSILEDHFSLVWITGEISNFRVPVSGHFYFTLKDSDAQINAVMFKGQNRNLKFMPEDGMNITGFGRISVYEPRGSYQIILEYLEPSGIGALQAAFEKLKAKLAEEGLFDENHKKSIPYLPRTICLITSPTGSVVHDMIRVIERRFKDIFLEIIPVKVQGDGAIDEILSGIELLNLRKTADVAILARGGGSLEDLSPFNSEKIARAIYASAIPIISAIGHETDYTIADFVADLRAPTPSAAAELVVPVKSELLHRHRMIFNRLRTCSKRNITYNYNNLDKVVKKLIHPKKKLDDLRFRADDYSARLLKEFKRYVNVRNEKLSWYAQRLNKINPITLIKDYRNLVSQHSNQMYSLFNSDMNATHLNLMVLNGRLHALSPAAVLGRGYSITRTIPEKTIIVNSENVFIGDLLEILLSRGTLFCRVERKTDNGKNDF